MILELKSGAPKTSVGIYLFPFIKEAAVVPFPPSSESIPQGSMGALLVLGVAGRAKEAGR